MSRPQQRASAVFSRRQLLAAAVAVSPAQPALAWQGAATPAATGANGEWSFTDDRGVTVTLPERPKRIVAQVTSAASLWDYGIRPLAVFGPQRREDGSQDPQSGTIDLEAVESLGEIWGEFDLEGLIALQPDLLISAWWGPYQGEATPLSYIPEEAVPVVDEVVPSIGILVEDIPIARSVERYAELAETLGADLASLEIAADKERYDRAVADLEAAIAENPGLTVLAVSGLPDNLYVAHPTPAADLILLRELGLDVVVPEVDPEEYWETLSWEEANKYPADLILNDARTQAMTEEQLMEIPTWRELPAVKAGQVADWRLEPIYSWRGYAPILEELAGVIRHARADVV